MTRIGDAPVGLSLRLSWEREAAYIICSVKLLLSVQYSGTKALVFALYVFKFIYKESRSPGLGLFERVVGNREIWWARKSQ